MNKFFSFLLVFWIGISLFSCRRPNDFYTGDNALRFSVDTLSFDTVFTQMGSSTRRIKVYNLQNEPIKIEEIFLGGTTSFFKLNIDGKEGNRNTDVEIAPKDSAYIFVQVTIDPRNSNNPLLVEDSILAICNGKRHKSYLRAFGQDANYIGRVGAISRFPANSQIVFTNTKPIVLMGWILIDSSSTLTIEAGTKLHLFGGPRSRPGERGLIYIGHESSLKIIGTPTNPVKLSTHRLESEWRNFPSNWEGIWLSPSSKDNEIKYTLIRNANFGLIVDSLSINNRPKLKLENSVIYDAGQVGIIGIEGNIEATNCLIMECSEHCLQIVRGGNYDFKHCTFAGYAENPYLSRSNPILYYANFQTIINAAGQEENIESAGNAHFTNCIIYGNQREEVNIGRLKDGIKPLLYQFENCLIKADTFKSNQINCILNKDPRFKDTRKYDYHIDTLISPAVNAGKDINIFTDLDGRMRPSGTAPDIGAYEFEE